MVTNTGVNALEVFEQYPTFDSTDEAFDDADEYVSRIMPPGSFLIIPTQRSLIYDAKTSAANVSTLNGLTMQVRKPMGVVMF